MLRGEFDLRQALIDGLLSAITAGVVNATVGRNLMGKIDDLLNGFNRACSFSGDTRVVMADGSTKPISEIELGDWVLSYQPETGRAGPREVTDVWAHADVLTDLVIDGSVVRTTEDHPFWNVTDGEWQRADQLDTGDHALTSDGGVATVGGFVPGTSAIGQAYNLSVDQLHTYYVTSGDDDVLVHNACRPPATDNYRGRYQADRWANDLPPVPKDWDVHHKIPQYYRDHPDFADFDFHDPSNLVGVQGSRSDNNIHQQITNEWSEFQRQNPNATRSEIEAFRDAIDSKYADAWWD